MTAGLTLTADLGPYVMVQWGEGGVRVESNAGALSSDQTYDLAALLLTAADKADTRELSHA